MVGQILVNPLIEELAPKVSVQPELVSRSFSDPVDLIDTLGASSAMLSDTGAKPLLPALTARTPTPRRAPSALSVGILLYLLSIGIVATATVGVFFGIAFFFLAQTTQPMNENAAAGEHGSDTERPLSHAVPSTPSTHGDSASVAIEPWIPRSAATAALPVVAVVPPTARPSPVAEASASDPKNQSGGKEALGSESHQASLDASPPAAPTAKPAPGSSVATPAPTGAPALTAVQIGDLLTRGDTFLHAGDVASARLFYERATDAGDWRAAIRLGATFDPAFLSRAGVRTVGDPIEAQSWYRHALDLGAPKTDRQVESPKTQ